MEWTDEQIYHWYNRNIDIQNRVIYFGAWQDGGTGMGDLDTREPWEVNDWSAQNVLKGLHLLGSISKEAITILWFSYGGDWDAVLAKCQILPGDYFGSVPFDIILLFQFFLTIFQHLLSQVFALSAHLKSQL